MSIRFDGQVAVVTGAGNGLGRAYAMDLARRGAKVIVNDLGGDPNGVGEDTAPAQRVVNEIRAAGGEASANYDSVADHEGGYNIVKQAIDTYGRLDIAVCNAGILRDQAFHNMNEEAWDKVFAVHIKGCYNVLHAAWPVFRQQAYGRVVMACSASGIWGNFGQANYGSAKTAMIGLMNVIKQEGAKYNINVNLIAPIAATRMTEANWTEQRKQELTAEHVVPAVTYLCAKECTDTGLIIEAAGGEYNRAVIMKAKGINGGPDVKDAEWVQAHWGEITSLDGLEEQWALRVPMKDYLAQKAATK